MGSRVRAPSGGMLMDFWDCDFLELAAVELGWSVGGVRGA